MQPTIFANLFKEMSLLGRLNTLQKFQTNSINLKNIKSLHNYFQKTIDFYVAYSKLHSI